MRIKTARGFITATDPAYAEELFELVHHSRKYLYKWMPWLKKIHSVQDVRYFIEKLLRDSGPQFVVCLDDETICGGIGFYTRDDPKTATIGYWLGEDYVGQGLMGDALVAACRYGFNEAGFETLEMRCTSRNEIGRKVPERLGFRLLKEERSAEWLSEQVLMHAVYVMDKVDFAAIHGETADESAGVSGFTHSLSSSNTDRSFFF